MATARANAPLRPGVKTTHSTSLPASGSNAGPQTPHPDYALMERQWERASLLLQGTDAIHDAGEKVIPRYKDEEDANYDIRKGIAAVENSYKAVIGSVIGLLLQKEIVTRDMPKALTDFWEDVDGAGTHGQVFTEKLLRGAVSYGISGIITDYPRVAEDLNRDQEAKANVRPFWILTHAVDRIKEIWGQENGVRVLKLFIAREEVEVEGADMFSVVNVVSYRVYRRTVSGVTFERWTVPQDGGDPVRTDGPFYLMAGGKALQSIPWSPLSAGVEATTEDGKTSTFAVDPPLDELAHLVFEHHRIKTGALYLGEVAMVPTRVRIGAPRDKDGNAPPLQHGPLTVNEAPNMTGVQKPIYWDSPDVSVLEPAAKALDRNRAAQGVAGMQFLTPEKRSAETARAKELDKGPESANISRTAGRLQDCLEFALQHVALFLGLDPNVASVVVNREFENALMEPGVMAQYAALVKLGYPKRLAVLALQAGGRIPPDEDVDAIIEEWEVGLEAEREIERVKAEERAAEMADKANLPEGGADE